MTIPMIIVPVKINAELIELSAVKDSPMKNIPIIEIRSGKRPLQGTKLFVNIAISLSLGESIMRHPIIPQALQPNPMHIVSDCFPWQPHFLKIPSKLKAIRGK